MKHLGIWKLEEILTFNKLGEMGYSCEKGQKVADGAVEKLQDTENGKVLKKTRIL